MNPQHLIELLDVVKAKNKIDQHSSWSNGSETYLREIGLELGEVTEELKLSNRQGYLEEELGDVFWDYLNLLLCLEQEGRIDLSRVFERSVDKYRERIEGIQSGKSWSEIKKVQKERLEREHLGENSGKE